MIINVLVENTSVSENYGKENGLSIYIETKTHKILFDVGASELFFENAKKLGVKIADVDYLVISHGHYDHGGGLKKFLKENTKAEVFLHHLAFEKHYAIRPNDKIDFIGLDEDIKNNKQIVFTSDRFFINAGIQVFSNIIQKEPQPKSNGGLITVQNGQAKDDTFAHEQNLIIEEDGISILVTGCAHNGIINIIEHFKKIKGKIPDYVIGGFHLSSRSGNNEDYDTVDNISEYLMGTKAKFYTCYCTGLEAYERLKNIMGDSIEYLSSGSKITI